MITCTIIICVAAMRITLIGLICSAVVNHLVFCKTVRGRVCHYDAIPTQFHRPQAIYICSQRCISNPGAVIMGSSGCIMDT